MELKITGAEFAYSVLQSAHLFRETPEDAKRDEIPNLEKVKRAAGIAYPFIQLDEPLGKTIMQISRSDVTYRAFMLITSKEPVFENISLSLVKSYKKAGKIFLPSTSYGTGRLLDASGKPSIGMIEAVFDDKKAIDIGIGCNGAYPRKFENAGDMTMDFGDLEEAVNIFLNTIYESLVRSKRIKKIPEGVFYMNP